MRIWGYLLIFLNLLAAGAFIYLTTAVLKQKREWTTAYLKAEIQITGTAIEKPEAMDEIEEFVRIDHHLGGIQRITHLPRDLVKKLVPTGGTGFMAAGADEFITSQSAEVERLWKKFEAELEKRKDNPETSRTFLRTYLLNLARTGPERDGIHALLRDFPNETWRATGRRDLPLLAPTELQFQALRAATAIAFLDDDLARQKPTYVQLGRESLTAWSRAMMSQVVPLPIKNAKGERPDLTKYKEDDKAIRASLDLLLTEANEKMQVDRAKIDQAKDRLLNQSVTDKGPATAALLPYLASLAGNPLQTKEDLADARKQLLELALLPARTESEKKAMEGIVDLVFPPPLDAKLSPEELKKETDRRILQGPILVGTMLLKHYFDDAATAATKEAPATASTTWPSSLRPQAAKSVSIPHLLYHVDAHEKLDDRKLWHARVVAIVGQEAYVRAVETQSNQLREATDRVPALILQEQATFEEEYLWIAQYSAFLALRLEEVQRQLVEQQEIKKDQDALTKARLEEQTALENELRAVRAKTKLAIDTLKKRQLDLYEVTRILGEAQDALLILEQRVREMELQLVRP